VQDGEHPASRRTSALSWTASTALKVRARTPLTAAFCSQASVWGTWPDAIALDDQRALVRPLEALSLLLGSSSRGVQQQTSGV
jgi:hypothetical protein